jgi:hypothetical protein
MQQNHVKSVTLFGVFGRLYFLFAASVSHWKILTDQIKSFTLKRLSDVCWEAKIAGVKALRCQIGHVHDAFITLAENEERHDPDIAHEATTLPHELKDFSFLVSLVVWYDVLFQISVVSKSVQSQKFDVCKSVELIEGCHEFLKEYKENCVQRAISAATELAIDLEDEPEFQSVKRIRYVKCHFDYEAYDEPIMTPEKEFEIEFLNMLLDTALMSIKERFEQLHQHTETWGFLYKINKLPKKEDFIKHCADLQLA